MILNLLEIVSDLFLHLIHLLFDKGIEVAELLIVLLPKVVQLVLSLVKVLFEVHKVRSELLALLMPGLQPIVQLAHDILGHLVVLFVLFRLKLVQLHTNFLSEEPNSLLHLDGQVLQSREALVVGAFALPSVDVLGHHRVAQHLEQLFQKKWNVIPRL